MMDCGPTCLRMICSYYGKSYPINYLRKKCNINRDGVSLNDVAEASQKLGFKTLVALTSFEVLRAKVHFPVIIFWEQRHFVVVYSIGKTAVRIADPAHGLIDLSHDEFVKSWLSTTYQEKDAGLILALEPMPEFYSMEEDVEPDRQKKGFSYFLRYFTPYRKYLFQIFVGIAINMVIVFTLPYFNQAAFDIGIDNNNLQFIFIILLAQFVLSVSQLFNGYIRSWLFLNIGTRVSISIMSQFITKLFNQPFSFLETKTYGDINQRMGDQSHVQSFITTSTLSIIFSSIELVVYSVLLVNYDLRLFATFFLGNTLYIVWTVLFLRKRKSLNYRSFKQASDNQNINLEIIEAIQEIKLQNMENIKLSAWENQQIRQFNISAAGLKLSQQQQTGAFLIDKVKNFVIMLIVCAAVINGDITIGMMMSITYILGQLSGPTNSFLSLINSYQDAKISLDRITEVIDQNVESVDSEKKINVAEDIFIKNLSFSYDKSTIGKRIIDDISLQIPHGKTTAIVGKSGSGKSTLVKLLLKMYNPDSGSINLGETDFRDLSERKWRKLCGIVSQEGHIFNDTIHNNVTMNNMNVNLSKLKESCEMAKIDNYIESLPLKYDTIIGKNGKSLSQGQIQRIIIARIFYKNPSFLFLDEFTNSLDSFNEKEILQNISRCFHGKTKIIIAHRLSTVKDADKVIVMEEGKIIEEGVHQELLQRKGRYYELVENQLK